MRVRVQKVATINRHTQTTFAAGDLTAPIHTGARPARPVAPASLRARVRAWWERLRGRGPVEAPVRAEPEAIVGTLVQFLKWNEHGRMDYNPFPRSADDAIEYERPIVVLLDGKGKNGEERIWFSSPVYSVSIGRYGLPSRCETRSSLYEIVWLETPVVPIEDVADER